MATVDELRAEVEARETAHAQARVALEQARQTLAEALCPFRVGDIVTKGHTRGRMVITHIFPHPHQPWSVATRKIYGAGLVYRCAPRCYFPTSSLRLCHTGRVRADDPRIPMIGERYRHFKGASYVVTGIVVGDDYRLVVMYHRVGEEDGETYHRPVQEWFDIIARPPYNGPRFIPED